MSRPLWTCLLAFTITCFASSVFASNLVILSSTPTAIALIKKTEPAIPEEALSYAIHYYAQNFYNIKNPNFLTIIDYTASSRTKRMFVINMVTGAVNRYLVAHGKNSGGDIADEFSNLVNSYQTSLGMYLTGDTYVGNHGESLFLEGLDPTNSNATDRAIVLHGADYVSDLIAKTQSRLGRSQGCPAVDLKYSNEIIKMLKGGSLIYAYGK